MEKDLLLNFERILVFMRFDISNVVNKSVILILIDTLSNNYSNEEMCKLILKEVPIWSDKLVLSKTKENLDQSAIKKFDIICKKGLQEAKTLLDKREFNIAYDIFDILHVLPGFCLADNKKAYIDYWLIYVEPFQKKWKSNLFTEYKKVLID